MEAIVDVGGTPFIAFKANCHRALENQPLMGASKPASGYGN